MLNLVFVSVIKKDILNVLTVFWFPLEIVILV